MAKEDLITTAMLTEEERKAMATRAGIASGESRKKKKIFKEAISNILELPATDKMLKQIQNAFDIGKGTKLTLKEAMVYAQTIKAIANKDTQAFNALVDRVDGRAVQEELKPSVSLNIFKIASDVTNETLKKLVDVTPVVKKNKIEELI